MVTTFGFPCHDILSEMDMNPQLCLNNLPDSNEPHYSPRYPEDIDMEDSIYERFLQSQYWERLTDFVELCNDYGVELPEWEEMLEDFPYYAAQLWEELSDDDIKYFRGLDNAVVKEGHPHEDE